MAPRRLSASAKLVKLWTTGSKHSKASRRAAVSRRTQVLAERARRLALGIPANLPAASQIALLNFCEHARSVAAQSVLDNRARAAAAHAYATAAYCLDSQPGYQALAEQELQPGHP